MAMKKVLSPDEEKAKVLAQLDLKESALKKKMSPWGLSEEDFVQFLNLATKKDLVSQASDRTLQQIADDAKKTQEEQNKTQYRRRGPGFFDYLVLGSSGVMMVPVIGAVVVTAGAIGIGVPYICCRYTFGKIKEMARTFKASYQNDSQKGKLGRALRRAVEYPIFRVPLFNKMRRDMDFDGSPMARANFKDDLKEKRTNNAKEMLSLFAKSFKWTGSICAVVPAALSGLFCTLDNLGTMETMAHVLPVAGTGLLWGAGFSAAVCASAGVISVFKSMEHKDIRGRRLVEQAFNYPPVKEYEKSSEFNEGVNTLVSAFLGDDNAEENGGKATVENTQTEKHRGADLEHSLKAQTGELGQASALDKNQSRLDISINKKSYRKKKETTQEQKKTSRDTIQAERD